MENMSGRFSSNYEAVACFVSIICMAMFSLVGWDLQPNKQRLINIYTKQCYDDS